MNIIKNCFHWLFSFIQTLFKQQKKDDEKKLDYDATPEEKWSCNSFAPPFINARFSEEKGDGYNAFFEAETASFALELERKNLYAWVQNKVFRYKNFILESTICIEKPYSYVQLQITSSNEDMAGTCAVGWVFRNIEKAFYSVLVSDAGFLRVDVVINNTPKPLIPWTKLLESITNEFKLKIISFDSSITCLVNDVWVARIEDDVINAAGKIAFAGQNYNQIPYVKFLLKNIKINSRLIDVQNEYTKANDEQNVKKEARRNLSKSYYTIGNVAGSIAEIKQLEKAGLEAKDALLAGKVYFSARLIEMAEKYFIKTKELEPNNQEATIQLLNLYYYSNQYEKIKHILDELNEEKIETSSSLCNIKAHYLHYEGKHKEAAFFYNKAFNLSKKEGAEQGLFALNAAREYETAGDEDNAILSYIEASNMFLKTKQYVDLGQALNSLEKLAKDDERYWTLSAKFYYAIEEYDKANVYLELLIKKNSKDADVWYLYALILEIKKDKNSLKAFEKAYTLKPNESLYCFRYANALYSEGISSETYIKKAIELDEKNGWAYNLYAILMIQKNELNMALQYIEKAREYLPNEISVFGNYLHIKRMRGELQDCYRLFRAEASEMNQNDNQKTKESDSYLVVSCVEQNKAEAYHLFANELHQADELESAYVWYEKAVKIDPNNNNLLFDVAINSYMLGYLNEAQNYAVKVLDSSPNSEVYRLIACIAREMGDYERSEIALMQALNDYGKNEELLFELANLFLSTNKKEKAMLALNELKKLPNSENIIHSNKFIETEKLARG